MAVSRHPDVTPSACPLCAGSDRPPLESCRLCQGCGLVSRETAQRWRSERPRGPTSTTHTIGGLVEAYCLRLEARTEPEARELAVEGRDLLAIAESWDHSPAPGTMRHGHYRDRCSPFCRAAQTLIDLLDADTPKET